MKFSRKDLMTLLIMLAPDTGAGTGGNAGGTGDGGTGTAPGATSATDAAGSDLSDSSTANEPFDPSSKLDVRTKAKYMTQLKPEYQRDDFKGIETVDALYSGYRRLEKEVKSYDGAVKIPTAESTPDEIKGFFMKIGMPENEEGYQCDSFDLTEQVASPLKTLFRQAAFRNGLTKGQAMNMWAHEAATIQGFVNVAQQNIQKMKDTYEERYSALLEAEVPDATKRRERMTEEANLVKAFNEATGLGEYFEKTGLNLNPAFMHGLASWYRKLDPAAILGGNGGNSGSKGVRLRDMYSSMN